MPQQASLLDELRTQYEASRHSTQEHADVEGFQEIDARLRKAFRWLEKAITYLDGLKRSSIDSISVMASCSNRRVSDAARSGSMLPASWAFRCSTRSTSITRSSRPGRSP